MVEAQGAGAVLEVLLEQGNSLIEPARVPVDAGERAARAEGVGMIGAQDSGEVGEVLLEEGDGFVESARVPVGAGETVA